MKTTRIIRAACAVCAALACLLLMPQVVTAQASGGNLMAKVIDANKAPLPGVTITATNSETGFRRSEPSGADGVVSMLSIPVGMYTVTSELAGFNTVTVTEVKINVASTRNLEVTMSQSKVQESITVVDEAPLVQTSPSIGTVVSQQELQNLPLNGRQFANVAVLAPGTSLTTNTDPTKPGQLTVALNGGIGRNINFTVDGGDNTDDTIGGALQNYNLEAVQEFKIQTAQYKAEYGRSSGGVLSVVTKTGSNQFKGSAYEFARRRSLNSRTHTEELAGVDKQPYKRDQYGASLGGPILKDRAHFFATYEKLKLDKSYTIDTGGQFSNFDGRSIAIPFTDELATAKATIDISAAQLLQVRYGYQKNQDFYGQGSLTLPSALGTVNNKYSSILAGHTWQIGGDMLNEAVFQYTKFENGVLPVSSEPALIFPSGVSVGQNVNTPQTTLQTKYQYKDDFSFSRTLGGRRHDFKLGLAYVHEPTLGGSFTTGTAGQFTMLTDDPNGPVGDITVTGGFAGFSTPVNEYGVYVQDDWFVNDRLTLNLGLRYDLNTGIGGLELDQHTNPIWQILSTQTTYNESYLRDFQGGKGGKLKADRDNWAPRIGFSFDVKGDGRQILRGGVGRFYDFPYTNATVLFPAVMVQSHYGVVYNNNNPNGIRNPDGSLFHPGQPLPPAGAGGAIAVAAEVASPTLATPYSDQVSLGYSWQANNWLGITTEAIWSKYKDIPFRFRFNSTLDPNGNHQAGRRFAIPASARMWYGKGEAEYKGINLGFRVRQPKFELQGFYTFSQVEGNVLAGADEFRLGDANTQQADYNSYSNRSIDSRNPLCGRCFGPLYTDARHRLTFGGTYHAPWAIEASAFFRYHSPFPYNKVDLAVDQNGDGFFGDLRPGVAHVNTGRGSSNSQLDIRFSRDFVFTGDLGIELIVEVFNVFNANNPAVPDRFGRSSAFAGDPYQGEQRLAQLGLRLHF